MRDISFKAFSLLTAQAAAYVLRVAETTDKIENNLLPKRNFFDVARAAAFPGTKATPQLLPHCHLVCIDSMEVQFGFFSAADDTVPENLKGETGISIWAEGKSIVKKLMVALIGSSDGVAECLYAVLPANSFYQKKDKGRGILIC
ncbi:cyclic pyranopterin monophosphate synthase MoaC [Pedobacter rhizosphaerae]|uniref:MoaC family protein n=1 Tax=Pedobacter rhizosphaerae TaxID=390241 RepID=A0A1H9MLM6_9SPHI|nr:cyclic pyranopterin monophosphate synthase MoaC [Pedobacter rhizosphaerae]SER24451.1 MoaC family protein [Pedobacter rhizosphaerae]